MIRMIKIALIQILLLVLPVFGWAGQIPDTGQTQCYDNSGEISCPQTGESFYGQDAQYEGPARSYTKLRQGGVKLPDTATQDDGWIMTRDNVTGLIWEIKTDDESIHAKDDKYAWSNCQSVFIVSLNQQGFGGYSDWRMPTIKELASLVNSHIPAPGPTIDTEWFPHTKLLYYWSSTTRASDTDHAWRVFFDDGQVGYYLKSYPCYVRAVRVGQ